MNKKYRQTKFYAKLLRTPRERNLAYILRHKIYTEELQWTESQIHEIDQFDQNSDFIGIVYQDIVVGFVRLISYKLPWMYDSTFTHLLDSPIEKTPFSVEASRYLIAKECRKFLFKDRNLNLSVFLGSFLAKAVYHYCRIRKIDYVYFLPKMEVYRLFRIQGIPVEKIAEPLLAPDNVICVPALIDWNKLDIGNFTSSKYNFYKWFLDEEEARKARESKQTTYFFNREGTTLLFNA